VAAISGGGAAPGGGHRATDGHASARGHRSADGHPSAHGCRSAESYASTDGADPGKGRPADSFMYQTAIPPITAAAIM